MIIILNRLKSLILNDKINLYFQISLIYLYEINNMELKMKNCYACKIDKPLEEFRKDRTKKDGYNTYCKSCNNLKKGYEISRPKKQLKYVPEVNEWLQNNYNQLLINCKKVCGAGYKYWGEDLLPFIIEEFLYKSEEYQLQVYKDNKVEHWITNAMSFQLKSSTSPFYYHYRKNLINERTTGLENMEFNTSDDSDEEIITALHSLINKMDELDRKVCTDLYIEGKDIKETRKKYNITEYAMKHNIIKYKRYFQLNLASYY